MTEDRFKREWLDCDMLVVMGPTASGKTAFAVRLARWINSLCKKSTPCQNNSGYRTDHITEKTIIADERECFPYNGCHIISADSRQVYKGMDIGTGKDIAEYGEIPFHLIDIAEAGEKYDLFRYKRDFDKVYEDLRRKNVFPILCGGSGLYIEAVCKGYDLKEVAPNPQLRKNLEQKSMEELVSMLTNLKTKHGTTPHNNTDFDTKKRVIRAIEIELAYENQNARLAGAYTPSTEHYRDNAAGKNALANTNRESVISDLTQPAAISFEGKPNTLPQRIIYLALNPNRDVRNQRIDRRLEERLQSGMVEEIQALLDKGIKPEDLIYYGLEYKFITQYLTGEISYDYMKEHLAIAIHQFAKRQMTWLRGMERRGIKIEWITV